MQTKETILRVHLLPAFGRLRLDRIGYAEIQDYRREDRSRRSCSKKTVNNHLTVLRRLLVVAKKRELIEAVPEIEWLKAPKPDFDFLAFDEADAARRRGRRGVALHDDRRRSRRGFGRASCSRSDGRTSISSTGLLRVRRSVTRGLS